MEAQCRRPIYPSDLTDKKIKGRKRHHLVDTMGLVLFVVVHVANIQDRDGARPLLAKAKGLFPRLLRIWANGGYAGKLIGWSQETCGWVLEIIKRSDVVEASRCCHSAGWLNQHSVGSVVIGG
jgi:transposase